MSNDIRTFHPLDPARIRLVPRERVIYKRLPNPEKVGSLFVPQTSRYQDRNDLALVVGVGDGIDEVRPGDTLLIPELMQVRGKFSHGGETYTVIDKDQLADCAVVED